MADSDKARAAALSKLRPFQTQDLIDVLTAMDGLPVTVRLLDPPLHEFLPTDAASQDELARSLRIKPAAVRARIAQLRESNPMLGHRGARLCVTSPAILDMQVGAIVDATLACRRRGLNPQPRILHALIGATAELAALRSATLNAIAGASASARTALNIPIGTMIEVPRAALLADELAHHADFLCFGTNDLTQLTFGYSRDDSAAFLPAYLQHGLLPTDPFISLDEPGVGRLMRTAIDRARAVKPSIPISVCGEHAGDPRSIRFCHALGVDVVSCSPFRLPAARLAAGQSAIA
jgi:pyruvate,orthophosphate dikinase